MVATEASARAPHRNDNWIRLRQKSESRQSELPMFAALKNIAAHGALIESTPPKNPAERNTRAFHFIRALVKTPEGTRDVAVTIREDDNGNLYYNHSMMDEEGRSLPSVPQAPHAKQDLLTESETARGAPEDTARKAGPGDAEGGAALTKNIIGDDDGINLALADAQSRPRATPSLRDAGWNTTSLREALRNAGGGPETLENALPRAIGARISKLVGDVPVRTVTAAQMRAEASGRIKLAPGSVVESTPATRFASSMRAGVARKLTCSLSSPSGKPTARSPSIAAALARDRIFEARSRSRDPSWVA